VRRSSSAAMPHCEPFSAATNIVSWKASASAASEARSEASSAARRSGVHGHASATASSSQLGDVRHAHALLSYGA